MGPQLFSVGVNKTAAALKLLTVLEMTLVQFHAYQNKDHTLRIMSMLVKGRMKPGAGGQGRLRLRWPLVFLVSLSFFPWDAVHSWLETPAFPWASLELFGAFKCFSDSCPNTSTHCQQGNKYHGCAPLACGSGWTPRSWVLS